MQILSEVTDVVLADARRSSRGDEYMTARLIAEAFNGSGMSKTEMIILSDMLKMVSRD